MQISILSREDNRVIASLAGEVDADNCGSIGAALLEGPARVTSGESLDLHLDGLRFIDSSGVSELLRVREAVNTAGGAVDLIDPTPAVRRVLEITGLLEVFGLA